MSTPTTETGTDVNRRAALRKLGLAATAVYFAPQVTRLGTASAQGLPSPGCPPGQPGCTTPGPGNGGSGNTPGNPWGGNPPGRR
jgi:hypothetical protein